MERTNPLIGRLVELADSVDMATMAAERGHFVALHAWLEEIRDDAAKLAEATREGHVEAEREKRVNIWLKYPR